jgi:hypothetical protein
MRIKTIVTLPTIEGLGDIDLILCACGYESRARYASSLIYEQAKHRIAVGFQSQRQLAYAENKQWFTENDFTILEPSEDKFRECIEDALKLSLASEISGNIIVDISCFNRFRMANIVDAIRCLASEFVRVTFVYSLAKFVPPPSDAAPTMIVEPVIPQFAGWTNAPDKPPAAIVGLGYEPSKAIGVIDHLEINNAVWLYAPVGPIEDYLREVNSSNESLLNLIQSDGRKLSYSVTDPGALFQDLNSLVDLLKGPYNPLLIPFGPKIFALVALLVACVHEEVGVWRVSSGALEEAVDRKPSGDLIRLQVTFVGSSE